MKFNELRFKHDSLIKVDLAKADKKIKGLQESVDKYARENIQLHEKVAAMLSARSSSDDIQGLIQLQLNEVNVKYRLVLEENESLRARLETIFKEKSELAELLEIQTVELEQTKKSFQLEIERLAMDHANKIKDLNMDPYKEKKKHVTAAQNQAGEANEVVIDNQLDELEFEEHEDSVIDLLKPHMSVRDILMKGNIEIHNELEQFGFRHSGRNIAPIYVEQLEESIGFLEELEEKNKEIIQLRGQINELKQKMSEQMVIDPRLEEDIKKLILDLKHERESFSLLKEHSKKEAIHKDNVLKDFEDLLVTHKLKNEAELIKKDEEELNYMRKIKLLKYQVKLYEEQIVRFNESLLKRLL